MEKALGAGAIGLRGLPLVEAVGLAKEAGFGAVVFDIREVARLAEERGVEGVREVFARDGVRPASWGVPVAYRQDDGWDEELRALPALARVARELGCPRATAGVWPGSDERGYDENVEWHLERLRPIAEALAAEGCRLGLEFIGPRTFRAPYRYEFVSTLGGAMDLAEAIGTGNVGVLLDAWHLHASGGSVGEVARLAAEDVVMVHVNDAPAGVPVEELIDQERELPLATGVIDLVGFMGALREIGYDGPVMPEPFNKPLEELAAVDPVAAAKEAGRSMDALWRAAGLG